jgi:hypothetical protein
MLSGTEAGTLTGGGLIVRFVRERGGGGSKITNVMKGRTVRRVIDRKLAI